MDIKEKLILTIEINDKIVDSSTVFDKQTKKAFKHLSNSIRELLYNSKLTSYHIRSLTNNILTYWNESISPDTEIFWEELRLNNIDLDRKEPLRFALNKNRFKSVEQGIDARNYWNELSDRISIKKDFSESEIDKIKRIISEDERNRLKILKKCLQKNEIPQTQYLKFGECMAYFERCGLFTQYFKNDEVEQLFNIWKNFVSRPY